MCGFNNDEFYKVSKKQYQNVKVLGFLDDVKNVYNEIDILILPSFHEGLSYVVLEAMANGILVIANNILGVNSLIKNAYNGILIDNNQSEELLYK